MASFISMYQQPDEHETSSHANALSNNAKASSAYGSNLIVCNGATAVAVTAAHTFKNINTFKIDNDDDKRLRADG